MKVGLAGQPPAGILLIDKPQGWTSHDVVAKVRGLTGVKKVGHAGTLDPLATGLLIVLVGKEFTKKQDQLMKLDKEYWCEAELGMTTDSYDLDGEVTSQAEWQQVKQIDQIQLEKILLRFTGKIEQTVPAFSAVKIKGQKLYDRARRGQLANVTLPSREVEIKELELVEFQQNFTEQKSIFKIRLVCSSGTYVRSLIHDIGQELGVGAVVTNLRRTRIGQYQLNEVDPTFSLTDSLTDGKQSRVNGKL